MRSGWLLRDGDVICALEMTESFSERARGLRGRGGCEGGLLLSGGRTAHSAGVSFPLDVAYLSEQLVVVRVARLTPWKFSLGRRGVRSVLQFESGSLERWGVRIGDQLEIRPVT